MSVGVNDSFPSQPPQIAEVAQVMCGTIRVYWAQGTRHLQSLGRKHSLCKHSILFPTRIWGEGIWTLAFFVDGLCTGLWNSHSVTSQSSTIRCSKSPILFIFKIDQPTGSTQSYCWGVLSWFFNSQNNLIQSSLWFRWRRNRPLKNTAEKKGYSRHNWFSFQR